MHVGVLKSKPFGKTPRVTEAAAKIDASGKGGR